MHPVNISQLKAPRFAWGFLYEMQRIPIDDLPILRGLKSVGARDFLFRKYNQRPYVAQIYLLTRLRVQKQLSIPRFREW